MVNAETYLEIVRERGKKRLPLEDVYRQLYNPDLYLKAYGKIYRNRGAMTPGTTNETVDGMSQERIQTIIEALRFERYRWSPARRVYIEKKNSTKKRPLGLPTWSDKLLQEVIRMILEAYYEPQFSDQSHGFRPHRGCHTALKEIHRTWRGSKWFIEGDISQCFDTLDHEILMSILAEKIHDNRFLRLTRNLLKAGYLEEWKHNATISGTPQGGVVSPILSNIYLDRLDQYVEQTLLPANNRGEKRQQNLAYKTQMEKARRLRLKGKTQEARQLRRQAQEMPSHASDDANYRRLKYIRYADDFLLGFQGTRQEAEAIKQQLKDYLANKLKLAMSEQKTLITHAQTGAARFLGYDIETIHDNHKLHGPKHARTINGAIGLRVPEEVVKAKCQPYLAHGKPIHRKERTHDTVFTIVAKYQSEYRGVVEYYRMAYNLRQFGKLKWIMEQSLTKTLASKLKISVSQVHERYHAIFQVNDRSYKGLEVTEEREGKRSLVARWGGIPLTWNIRATLNDECPQLWSIRSEVIDRLLAEECELCGSCEKIQVHHIRALKNLQRKGRTPPPDWVIVMASRQRKTLVICQACHQRIHQGQHDGQKLGS
jgi:group II intron reverse transcriptase/maturase